MDNNNNNAIPPAPQAKTSPASSPGSSSRRAALLAKVHKRNEQKRQQEEARALEKKIKADKQKAIKDAKDKQRLDQLKRAQAAKEAAKEAKQREIERIREEKKRIKQQQRETIRLQKQKQKDERKAFEERKKLEMAKKREEHLERLKSFENRKLGRQEEEKERKRRQEIARKQRLEYERACRLYPIEDSLLYKEPEPPGFPLPSRPTKTVSLPIPNDSIQSALRIHDFCTMLSEALKLDKCTFEEFYMAINNSTDILQMETQVYVALLTIILENEYDDEDMMDDDEDSDEEDGSMPALPDTSKMINLAADIIAPLVKSPPHVNMLTTLNYIEMMRAYFFSHPQIQTGISNPLWHSAMFSLGQGKNSWELPFREKIALLNVLVDLVLDCESMAETLDKL